MKKGNIMMESDDCTNKLPQITMIKHKAWRAYNKEYQK